jgi:predicted permease
MKPTLRTGSYDPDPDRDIREEIEAHIEMEVESLVSRGMPEAEAREEARRLFGNRDRYEGQAKREARVRERRVRWMDRLDALGQDVRYALRRMANSPGFTGIAILSLALGIGANTAIFSIVNTLLLGGVPMRAPEELVEIYSSEREHGYPYSVSSVPDLMDLRERTDLFSGVAGYEAFISRYETAEATSPVMGELVTHDLFQILGIEPALGRFFLPEEGETPGTHPVVVLGKSFWERHFGEDPEILGRTLRVGGHRFTVIGVAPAEIQSFTAPGFAMDMWAPYQMADALTIDGDSYNLDDRGNKTVFIRARLRPGVTVEEVRAALATLSTRNQEAYPVAWKGMEYSVIPTSEISIHPIVDGPLKAASALLLSVVGLVLLLACVNLAGFLLARGSDRKKEIALRLALGARRFVLVRQLLVETLVLGLAGGAAGLLVANWVLQALVSFQPPIPFPMNLRFGLDANVLLFTLLISAAAGVFFGLLPALQSTSPDVAPTLNDEGGGGTGSQRRLTMRNILVVSQMAISMVLLLGAGLFIRSVLSAQSMDLGFDARDGAIAWVFVGMGGEGPEQQELTTEAIVERAKAIPGVQQVATAEMVPLGVGLQTTNWEIPGVEPPPGQDFMNIRYNLVSEGYFDAMEIPLVEGRDFTANDRSGSEPVAIVSEAKARRYWPGESAVGQMIKRANREIGYRVVGVAGDTKVWWIGEEFQPYIYLSRRQEAQVSAQIIARGSIPDAQIAGQLRRTIQEVDPGLVIMETKTMREHLGIQLFPFRVAAGLLGVFGLLALTLATTGLYGTVAFSVSKRGREMGIRLSLGADAAGVVRMVLRGAMTLVITGGVLGLLISAGLGQVVAGFLVGTSARDPLTFIGVPAVLVGVAALAAYVPARRASRVDPVRALKVE